MSAHHRAAFLRAFPDRGAGPDVVRLAQGHYSAIAGAGMDLTHTGDYLGLSATGQAAALPVMDFYRMADTADGLKIAENWVCLDLPGLFHQLGTDVLGGELADG